MLGTVKFYDTDKRFGFITGNDGKDYYFTDAGLPRRRDYDPIEGDLIAFDTRVADRGPIAHHINLNPDKDTTNAVQQLQILRSPQG